MMSLTNIRGTVASDHLDLARGLAAIAVLWSHARVLLFASLDRLEDPSPVLRVLYFLSAFGHQAVIVFFVLSGYFIGASVIRSAAQSRFDWSDYLVARGTRLYLVLVPGLLLTLALDAASGYYVSDDVAVSGDTGAAIISYEKAAQRSTAGIFAGNLFFLQEISVPPFGSNTALWSLSYEFWYYILFPCLVLCILAVGWMRVNYAVLVAVLFWLVGKEIAAYFAIWLVGVAVAFARPIPRLSGAAAQTLCLFGSLCVGLAVAIMKLRPFGTEFIRDAVTALGVAAVVYVALHCKRPSGGSAYSVIAATLAGFSFTLYVIHTPCLILCRSIWTNERPWRPDAVHLALAASIMIGIMTLAYCMAWLTERNTNQARSVVAGWIAKLRWPAKGGEVG